MGARMRLTVHVGGWGENVCLTEVGVKHSNIGGRSRPIRREVTLAVKGVDPHHNCSQGECVSRTTFVMAMRIGASRHFVTDKTRVRGSDVNV